MKRINIPVTELEAFSDEQALELGRSILQRFEDGLNGENWPGRDVVLPIQLKFQPPNFELGYPRDSAWCSSVQLSIPYFFRTYGPGDYKQITLNEWLKEQKRKK